MPQVVERHDEEHYFANVRSVRRTREQGSRSTNGGRRVALAWTTINHGHRRARPRSRIASVLVEGADPVRRDQHSGVLPGHPDWHVAFDVDRCRRCRSRPRQHFSDMAAAEKAPRIGFPFPFVYGHVEKDGTGSRLVRSPGIR